MVKHSKICLSDKAISQIARLAVPSALIALCCSSLLPAAVRVECEERLGREMFRLASNEGQRQAISSEIAQAVAAGMSVADVVRCLSIPRGEVLGHLAFAAGGHDADDD